MLLKEARDKNNSMEVAYKFNDFEDKLRKIYGDASNLNMEDYPTKFVLHNHPNNEPFSNLDLIYFVDNPVKYMSIVRHNGKINVLVKNDKFNKRDIAILYNRFVSKYKTLIEQNVIKGYNKVVRDIINKYDGIDEYQVKGKVR